MNEQQIASISVEDSEDVQEVLLEDVISELVEVAFVSTETVTSYRIATIVNGVFKATGTEKSIPPQMMYNYSKNGMIVKGIKDMKYRYNKEQVTAFVTRYTEKYV